MVLYYLTNASPINLFIYFIFLDYVNQSDLHSFPTRRSSDLRPIQAGRVRRLPDPSDGGPLTYLIITRKGVVHAFVRSEEHTSELQSHSELVCRLLLEKKNKTAKGGKFSISFLKID